jgi:hypothetical protein
MRGKKFSNGKKWTFQMFAFKGQKKIPYSMGLLARIYGI